MRRLHLFELTDQPWLPVAYRDMLTDYLQAALAFSDPYRVVAPELAAAIDACAAERVVDLCAGAGGPWSRLHPALTALRGRVTPVLLSDAFPHAAASSASQAGVQQYPQPVDARNVPPQLLGFRTLFSGLHHFRPADVRAILADAVRCRQGIAAFEATERSPRGLLLMLLAPLMVWLLTPRIRPLTWQRLVLTYLVPLVPLGVLFDGVVSCLRTYTPAELLAIANAIDAPGYRWEAGTKPIPGLSVTYLIGHPPA